MTKMELLPPGFGVRRCRAAFEGSVNSGAAAQPSKTLPRILVLLLFFLQLCNPSTNSANGIGSRFAYLAEDDPYYPHGEFPKFTTPAWAGDPEVEAVVVLSIDDMCRPFPKKRPKGLPTYARQPKVYFDFLKPIADRLMEIDGRAPISVFCLQLDPEDEIVQQMLKMGMSMECHTYTHPVPLMRPAKNPIDSLALVKTDFFSSFDSLSRLENSNPVAHRTPGCDARNTASPRFFKEVFPLADLQMDSSIFTAYLRPDPKLPREWYFKPDGTHRFASRITGIPFTKKFVNYVADYPYPYVINNRLWELPAIIPGDAHGVHAYGRMSDETVEDWKRALDITVAKQGVMTICFHPHGYIDSKQMVAFVDYSARTYGKKIKFLNCRDVAQRLKNAVPPGYPLHENPSSRSQHLDVDGDGHIDVLQITGQLGMTQVWNAKTRTYQEGRFYFQWKPTNLHFFTADRLGNAGIAKVVDSDLRTLRFRNGNFHESITLKNIGSPDRLHFRDLNRDGVSDIIADRKVYLSNKTLRWKPAPFELPVRLSKSVRFVDIDHDGDDDLVSSEKYYAIWLFENPTTGWSRKLISGQSGPDAPVPPIAIDGKNMGAWFRKDEMAVVNEFTANPKTDHVVIRKFSDWLKGAQ